MSSRYRYKQPVNEDEFEEFCLVLLREAWNRPKLERYGHRGESQYGVDIIDQSGQEPLMAVQCKHHAVDKTLPPSELKEEVKKALSFPDAIGEYYVLTTAKKGTEVQDEVRRINREHHGKGLFSVELLTWDEIERLVDQSPSARQCLGLDPTDGTVKAVQSVMAPLMGLTRISISVAEAAHGDLDEIKSFLDRGKPVDADVLATRLRSRAWSDLSDGQRWRLCTLAADAKLRLRLNEEAGQLLLEALTHAPGEEHAFINAIHALRMRGEVGKAKEMAAEASLKFPNSAAAHAECIELALSTEEARALIEGTPEALRDTGDVLAAIASRYDLDELSGKAARRGAEKYPEELRSWHVLGSWLLENELYKISPVEAGPTRAVERDRVLEAKDAFAKVIDLAQRAGHESALMDALSRRSVVYGLLDDWESAAKDIERALEIAPTAPQVLLNAARVAEARDDVTGTVSYLRRASVAAPSVEIRFYLGIALWNQNHENDREAALELLDQVAREQSAYREPSLEMAIEGYVLLQNLASALDLLEHVALHIDPVALFAHRARLAKVADDGSEAQRFASEAIAKLSDQTKRVTRRLLAKNLMYLERFQDALPILQGLAVPDAENEAGRRLVDCAIRLDRQDVVLTYCARARDAGIYDGFLLERELQLLEFYDPGKAIEILQEILKRDPDDHTARVHLALIATRENRLELLREYAAQLPNVEVVDASEGAAVVGVLQAVGRHEDAATYAYDLLRRFFADHRAHRAFWNARLFNRSGNEVVELEAVVPGAAVLLKEPSEAEGRWYVLEDSSVPATGVPNEEASTSAFAKLVMNKHVGEHVDLGEGVAMSRTAVVTAIVPKAVFRVRDVLNQWQYRFPEHKEIWMGHCETIDGEPDVQPLLDMFEAHRRRDEHVLQVYRQNAVPLHVLADGWNIGAVESLWRLAHIEAAPIRCCLGTADEIRRAQAEFSDASEVVLDLSAIASVAVLDCIDDLKGIGRPLVISPVTMRTIRSLGDSSRFPFGFAQSLVGGWNGAELFAFTLQQQDERKAFFSKLIELCEVNCKVQESTGVAKLAPDARKILIEAVGWATLESLVLARQPGRVLWCDDGASVAIAAQADLRVPRTWTQLVLRSMVNQSSIEAARFVSLSAKLVGCGYTFTQSDDGILCECGQMATWKFDKWPLRQAIETLGTVSVHLEPALGMGAKMTAKAYLELVVPEDRQKVLVAILAALGRRGDFLVNAVDAFGQLLVNAFGLNSWVAQDAIKTFEAWRRGRTLW